MKVGDLVRLNSLWNTVNDLRIVKKITDTRIETIWPYGTPSFGTPTDYVVTHLTIEEACQYPVKLRTIDFNEMLSLCSVADQRPIVESVWGVIIKDCVGKIFTVRKGQRYQTAHGWVDTKGTCGYVLPSCCLTLALPSVIDKCFNDYEKRKKQIIPPPGWDNCSQGFCLGDWLIASIRSHWEIDHPKILPKFNHFASPDQAAKFVEERLCK